MSRSSRLARPEGLGTDVCGFSVEAAITSVLSGTTWQRCRVHFMRSLLATVPQGARAAIAAIARTIYA